MSLSLPESLGVLMPDGNVKRIFLQDYVRGVVAGALPADAPLEGMKALAVAARTFAASTHRHEDRNADVCTTRHCQAWSERANPRAARAVIETRDVVLVFRDAFIQAFYFEHCDGKTRDAKGVLLDAPPYLQSVPCPCGFAALKGHGIGMCLRGMLAMARLGERHDSILTHYYSGVSLHEVGREGTVAARTNRVTLPASRPARGNVENAGGALRATQRTPSPTSLAGTEPTQPAAAPESASAAADPKPPRKTIAPRRVVRKKPEAPETPAASSPVSPAPAPESVPAARQAPPAPAPEPVPVARQAPPSPAPESVSAARQEPPSPAPEPVVTLGDAHSREEDDLFFFLTVEDAEPSRTAGNTTPPVAAPPASMPEEMPAAADLEAFVTPPPSMPEEVPSASELDFLAPPSSLPEDVLGAPPEEFLHAAHSVEPNLGEFLPPVEKFYTPLDAPPTMPEAMPTFNTERADEMPFAWVAPPPLQENAYAVKPPQLLMDVLPGPRVIAGNLPKAGMMVTIRDGRGNSVVTVSGAARQYGSGGFEAPLTDDGAYHVKFDGTELDVKLENETVFLYYS